MTKSAEHQSLRGLVRDLSRNGSLPTYQMQKLYRLAGSVGRKSGRTVTQVISNYTQIYSGEWA